MTRARLSHWGTYHYWWHSNLLWTPLAFPQWQSFCPQSPLEPHVTFSKHVSLAPLLTVLRCPSCAGGLSQVTRVPLNEMRLMLFSWLGLMGLGRKPPALEGCCHHLQVHPGTYERHHRWCRWPPWGSVCLLVPSPSEYCAFGEQLTKHRPLLGAGSCAPFTCRGAAT